jgi:hypothetical protein
MRISVLSRGGLAAYGASYDPKCDEIIANVRDGETISATIEYPSAPTSPTADTSGLTCSAPAISGNKLTFTLTAINDAGRADITATVGGATKTVRIVANQAAEPTRY